MAQKVAQVTISQLQIDVLKDLARKYPPQLFKHTGVDLRVKNTMNIICQNCKSDNVYVESKQLRSADEATSKIYTCLNCGNTWRIG